MHLKLLILGLVGVVGLVAVANADDGDGRRAPNLDPKRIINESMRFLKDREPDVTAEESALYERANQLLTTNPTFALTLLEEMVAKPEGKESASPAFELLLGNVYYASGAIEKAEARYRSAVHRYPSFLRAWTNLGVLYYAAGRYDQAIPCFAKAVTLGDRDSATFGMMGYCLERTGDAVGAELAYVQALASNPGNVNWTEGLLRVYLAAKQYSRAEVMVRSLIQERPTQAGDWLTLAHIMAATDRKLEAIALLEQALATGVGGDEEVIALAGLYADERMFSEAAQTYRRVHLNLRTLGEQRSLQLARILINRSEFNEAQTLLDSLAPTGAGADGPAFLQAKADLLCARKQWSAARTVLQQLLQREPMNGDALVSLGRTYLGDGDETHAELAFESAVQTTTGVRAASIALANLELKHRHFEQCAAHLERAIELERNRELEDILGRVRPLIPKDHRTQT
jgi:tetratricopeptide (TPR) repeat protein